MFYDDDLTKIIDQYATPAAREVDANGEFPQASINALQSVDLLGITVSEEFGGGGLGHVHRRDPGEDPETRPPGAPAWLGLGVTVGGKQDYLGDGELADVPGAAPGCPRPRRDRRTRARARRWPRSWRSPGPTRGRALGVKLVLGEEDGELDLPGAGAAVLALVGQPGVSFEVTGTPVPSIAAYSLSSSGDGGSAMSLRAVIMAARSLTAASAAAAPLASRLREVDHAPKNAALVHVAESLGDGIERVDLRCQLVDLKRTLGVQLNEAWDRQEWAGHAEQRA